jgi:hypothetical protein
VQPLVFDGSLAEELTIDGHAVGRVARGRYRVCSKAPGAKLISYHRGGIHVLERAGVKSVPLSSYPFRSADLERPESGPSRLR